MNSMFMAHKGFKPFCQRVPTVIFSTFCIVILYKKIFFSIKGIILFLHKAMSVMCCF